MSENRESDADADLACLNRRRWKLINRLVDGGITEEEQVELNRLQELSRMWVTNESQELRKQ